MTKRDRGGQRVTENVRGPESVREWAEADRECQRMGRGGQRVTENGQRRIESDRGGQRMDSE